MLKYAQIVNEETKQCEVGLGTNTEFYKSIGMTEMDVEQAYDGQWYVSGYAPKEPEPTEEELKYSARGIRNSYLSGTDYTQLSDVPFTDEEKEEYREYRQYLRDYTDGEEWWKHNPLTFEEWRNQGE